MTPPGATDAASDSRIPPDVSVRLHRLLGRLVARSGVRHAQLAMASGDGTRRWAAANGPDEDDIGADTPFFVASITKRFIATLVLQAHERGEIHLDDPINHHLPSPCTDGLHRRGGVDHTGRITVRHLLSHTSGLPDHFERRQGGRSRFAQLKAGQDVDWSLNDVLQITREEQRPHFEPQDLQAPRQKARYSDTGFQLLIAALEEATGQSFGTLLRERILQPVGMTETWLPAETGPHDGHRPHLPLCIKAQPVALPALIRSSNDLISTTGDLLSFHRALLTGALHQDPGTVELLTERGNRLRNAPVLRYGLGTMTFRVNRLASRGRSPLTLVGHSGATGTWLFHCPELDVHVAGTINQTRAQAAPFRIMARCLNVWRDGSGQ